tara:strand:- start:1832 stop:2230 length:399 start_codon:yes stop_codon:yes gene_type:complete
MTKQTLENMNLLADLLVSKMEQGELEDRAAGQLVASWEHDETEFDSDWEQWGSELNLDETVQASEVLTEELLMELYLEWHLQFKNGRNLEGIRFGQMIINRFAVKPGGDSAFYVVDASQACMLLTRYLNSKV